MTVEILLATYNGASYIAELLHSLKQQSYSDIALLIRDDNSIDQTAEIAKQETSAWSTPVRWVSSDNTSKGVIGNFSTLMEHSIAPYVMFADQDDVWLPQKVEKTLKAMQELEQRWGKECPLLVHSDLRVVDKDLKTIAPSFWKYANIAPERHALHHVLVENSATGCAMMVNKALLKRALPLPTQAIMHDWWLLLVAAAFGKVGLVNEPTILYRQHGSNQVGAKSSSLTALLKRLTTLSQSKQNIARTIDQAAAFYECYQNTLDSEQRHLVQSYLNLRNQSFLQKRATLLRHCFFKHSLIKTLGLFCLI